MHEKQIVINFPYELIKWFSIQTDEVSFCNFRINRNPDVIRLDIEMCKFPDTFQANILRVIVDRSDRI